MADDGEVLAEKVRIAAIAKKGKGAVRGGKNKGGIECFALIDEILRTQGAKSAADFGAVTPDANYVWGTEVQLDQLQPGDILQFRNHIVTVTTERYPERGWKMIEEKDSKRPHHSAIVVEVRDDKSVVVVEQSVNPHPNTVTQNVIPRLAEGEETRRLSVQERKRITVVGIVKAYRPVAKDKGTFLFRLDDDLGGERRRMFASFVPGDGGPSRPIGPLGLS